MKKITFLLLFAFSLLFPSISQARVYWIGRDIDMALQFGWHSPKKWWMVRAYGHSLLVVIPQNPAAFARLYNPQNPQAYFTELEKDFGSGYKGFVIAAYAEKGTQTIGHADGYLTAHINAPREVKPLQDFFAAKNQEDWHFVAGEVYSPYTDEQFALRLLRLAQNYIALSSRHPLPYGTFHSIMEPVLQSTPDKAVNCNAFAYSLVRYAGATGGPDLYAQRVMPGISNLLPARLFFKNPPEKKSLLPFQFYSLPALQKKQEQNRRLIIRSLKEEAAKMLK